MRRLLHNPRFWIGAVLGVACLIIYAVTMAPDIGANDVAEWQATGATLGIAHAPGSPAYTILSWLLTLAPFSLPAARVTFLSVVMGAAGVVAVYAFMVLLLNRVLPAIVSAATLALAGMWWSHATVATPYNAVLTIMAVLLVLLLLWSRSGNIRFLWGAALLAGFGLAYHPLVMFFLPVPIAGVFFLGRWKQLLRLKPVLILTLLFMTGLSFYLYLPIRGATGPAIQYQKINSLSKMISFVSASHAHNTRLQQSFLPNLADVQGRLDEVVYSSYNPSFLILIFAPSLALFLPGVWRRLRFVWRWLVFLAAGMIVQMFLIFVLTDIYAHYYLPLLFYFAVWAGLSAYLVKIALDKLAESDPELRQLALIVAGIFYFGFFGLLVAGTPHTWAFANHRNDRDMRDYVNFVFSRAKPGAVVMGDWETYTGLVYAQKVEGQRPDIILLSVSQQGRKAMIPNIESQYPAAQILLSEVFNIYSAKDVSTYGWQRPLTNKALTYQDFNHGKPYPLAAQLLRLVDSIAPFSGSCYKARSGTLRRPALTF